MLTIIELFRQRGARVSYNDPFFPYVGRAVTMISILHGVPLDNLEQLDCVLIVIDHSDYDLCAHCSGIEPGDWHSKRDEGHWFRKHRSLLNFTKKAGIAL